MASSSSSSKSRGRYSLSDDILIEIFAYLPLNSIHKFKCLSKVLLSNLSNPNFVTKWFQLNRKSLPWILYHSNPQEPSNKTPLRFSYAFRELYSEFMSRNEHLFSFKFLMNKLPFQVAGLYLLGSSNGLVLCFSRQSDEQIMYHVCNPLTQKWVSLPSPPHSKSRGIDVSGIFCGYSSSLTSCYKVVRIPAFNQPSKKLNVDMFCSDVGVWERFEVSCDENVVFTLFTFDKVVNGVLYWIQGRDRMLAYNLNQKNEISDGHRCSLINLPYMVEFDHDEFSCIGESEGRVCYAKTRTTSKKMAMSVWVLNEVNWQNLHKDILLGDMFAEIRSRTGEELTKIQILGFSPVDRNVVLLGCKHWVYGLNLQSRSVEELCSDNTYGYGDTRTLRPFVLKPMPTVLPPFSWINTSM